MTQSITRVIASGCGVLILFAFGAAVPAYALQYCRTAHQFCFAYGQAGSSCSCADNSGTAENGVIVEAPSAGSAPQPKTTVTAPGAGAGASGEHDTVDRAGSSSDNPAGSMFHHTYGGSRNSTTTGRELSPMGAPSTTYMPPPSMRPQSAPPPPAPSSSAPARAPATNQVRTTRSFFGPHDIPPENFAAYGIVAFPQKATPATIRRHQSICEAFLATLPPVSASSAPISQQMVTVWPIDNASLAERLNKASDASATKRSNITTYRPA